MGGGGGKKLQITSSFAEPLMGARSQGGAEIMKKNPFREREEKNFTDTRRNG